MNNRELTILISSLAVRQDGVVNRQQLLRAGAAASQIDSRVRNRSLQKLYAGVYAVGHDRLSARGRMRAACMAGGKNAVLSHRSAAELHGLLPPTRRLEVVRTSSPDPHQPPPAHASREIHPGLIIHRTRSLRKAEVTTRFGLPVTSLVRTTINLAERESPKTLETVIRKSVSRDPRYVDELNRAVAASRGRKGMRKLRRALQQWNPAQLHAKSGLELAMTQLCRDHGVPDPIINDMRCGYEVDFQWAGSKVIVETDGGTYHQSKADRHRDYLKDLDLTAAGLTVCRLDETMIIEGAAEVGAKLRKLLEEEGAIDLQPISPQPVAVSDRAPP